ncbi:MAG: permease [Ramlibacter sp.]|uniref:esterase/lipase family protein n=1 Tax=Ramlibacter sp. TaxID=1917967 RepID=UPI0026315443|nr:alpha/beta fold hydrolase [Ramlibacter sp.]MDH4377188.1 permease [Ramlibacter sp.]
MDTALAPWASQSLVARFQRLGLFCQVAVAAVSGGLLWPDHPWLAGVVGFSVLLLPLPVLGLEFLLLRRVGRADPVPLPGWPVLVSAWVTESAHYLRVFCWQQPFRWRAIPDRLQGEGIRGRRGVVLVHGFCCNRGFWNDWMQRLTRENRAFVAVNLEPVFSSIDGYVPILDHALSRVEAATGLPPLLVCHSMGGLVARAWLEKHRAGGAYRHDPVFRVVTIGSPHHGTWLARFSHTANGRQMREGSDWMEGLQASWAEGSAGLPPHRFTCWYSNADNIVMPPSSGTLRGADNRLVQGVGHVALAQWPEVIEGTLAYLDEGT